MCIRPVDVGLGGTVANAGANFCDKSCDERVLIGVKLNETFGGGESFKLPLLRKPPSILLYGRLISYYSVSTSDLQSIFDTQRNYLFTPFEFLPYVMQLASQRH